MKKTYIAPATTATLISTRESLLDVSYGGTNKVTSEDQVLSNESVWDDEWDDSSAW